jgi:hypothetical protein
MKSRHVQYISISKKRYNIFICLKLQEYFYINNYVIYYVVVFYWYLKYEFVALYILKIEGVPLF